MLEKKFEDKMAGKYVISGIILLLQKTSIQHHFSFDQSSLSSSLIKVNVHKPFLAKFETRFD